MECMDVDPPGPLYARLFARAPIYDLIFACLSPCSLVRLELTCHAAYGAIAEFKTRAFNINRTLSRYFTDPVGFRSVQARTNTLVSGSTALQFFDRTFYPEADLDVYTHPGHSFEVAQFLVQDEGYHYVPREFQEGDWKVATSAMRELTARRVPKSLEDRPHAYPTTDIRAVWTFQKENDARRSQGQQLTVQIIETQSSPLESILGFHLTCVMNFISSDAAYALFPIATLEHRITLTMPKSASSSTAIEKYARRGWRIYFVPALNEHAFSLERTRWVTDRHTWVLPLDQTGVQARPLLSRTSAPLPCDPALFNGWTLRPCREEGDVFDITGYKPHYFPVKSTLFRYNYAIPIERMQLTIREWTRQQGPSSHLLISKDDWAWFDSDIPNFLRMVVGSTHGDGRVTRVELGAPRALV